MIALSCTLLSYYYYRESNLLACFPSLSYLQPLFTTRLLGNVELPTESSTFGPCFTPVTVGTDTTSTAEFLLGTVENKSARSGTLHSLEAGQ